MIVILVALSLVYAASAVPLPSVCGKPAIAPNLNKLSSKVVGGKEAIQNSWPWQVQVRYNGGHYCGASILSNDWMLCAAHCVYGSALSGYSLRAGRHTRSGVGGTDAYEQISAARQIIYHESYNPSTINNDVSLIRISTAFTFNNQVSPVCLTSAEPAGGTSAWLTGWGNVQGTCCDGKLKQAMLPIIARTTCSSSPYWTGMITSGMICAGYADASQGGCNGDSGGPLVTRSSTGIFSQVGIVSWGSSTCKDVYKPTVFANVNYFRTWITSKITMLEKEEEEIQARKFHPRLGAAFRALAKSLEE